MEDMIRWYVWPAVVVSCIIWLVLCTPQRPDPDFYTPAPGVNKAEIVGRWNQ